MQSGLPSIREGWTRGTNRFASTVQANDDDRELFFPTIVLSKQYEAHADNLPSQIFVKAFQKVVHLALFVELELASPTRLTTRHSTKQCHKHRPPRLRLASSDSYAYGHNMGLFNYYAFGLPSFIVLVIALYLLFTGTSYSTRSPFGVGLKVRCDARCYVRLWRSIQCRKVLGGVKSLCVGEHWYRVVYWVQCAWCRMVRPVICMTCVLRLKGRLGTDLQGYLRDGSFNPWWRCEGTSDTYEELDQVRCAVDGHILEGPSLMRCLLICSVIFCEVVAIYGVVRTVASSPLLASNFELRIDHGHRVLRKT